MSNRIIYVRDDNLHLWFFDEEEGRIRMVGDDTLDGGYECSSFEEGVYILNQYEYITDKPLNNFEIDLNSFYT